MNLLELYAIDYKIAETIKPEAVYEAMFGDKKVLSGKIRFVLTTGESTVDIFDDTDKKIVTDAIKSLYFS